MEQRRSMGVSRDESPRERHWLSVSGQRRSPSIASLYRPDGTKDHMGTVVTMMDFFFLTYVLSSLLRIIIVTMISSFFVVLIIVLRTIAEKFQIGISDSLIYHCWTLIH